VQKRIENRRRPWKTTINVSTKVRRGKNVNIKIVMMVLGSPSDKIKIQKRTYDHFT
jgi:hypothetical protein